MSSVQSGIRRPPYVSTLLAVSSVLLLLGCYAVIVWQGRDFLRELRESISVVVELRERVSQPDREAFEGWLARQPYTKASTVRFISKQEGAQLLADQLGTEGLDFNLDNPLYDIYTLNLTEQSVSNGRLDDIESALRAQDVVLDAYLQRDVIEQVATRVDSLAYVGLALGLLLTLGVVFLILNTTRLALLSRRRLIKSMELVGASWGFIARPFLRRAVVLGALAGLLATAGVLVVSAYAKTWLTGVWEGPTPVEMSLLAAGLVLLGVLLNFASTYFVIRRTLKMRVDDLASFG